MRSTEIVRNTLETKINIKLNIDGSGKCVSNTGVGFLDHMMILFAKHGRFDIEVQCDGDTYVDYHHSVEDIGICLGKAFAECLGDMKGINRYGNFILPMDETLIMCAIDISGRAYINFDIDIPTQKVGDFDTELVKEFFISFVRNINATLHLKKLHGENSHHIIEASFKAFARALSQAVAIDEKYKDEIPSTKGVL